MTLEQAKQIVGNQPDWALMSELCLVCSSDKDNNGLVVCSQCNEQDNGSACGACGEWNNGEHNCSEEDN
jgi:hypothetical protein